MHILVRELEIFGWITCTVLGMRGTFFLARGVLRLVAATAITVKMQESDVHVCVKRFYRNVF